MSGNASDASYRYIVEERHVPAVAVSTGLTGEVVPAQPARIEYRGVTEGGRPICPWLKDQAQVVAWIRQRAGWAGTCVTSYDGETFVTERVGGPIQSRHLVRAASQVVTKLLAHERGEWRMKGSKGSGGTGGAGE